MHSLTENTSLFHNQKFIKKINSIKAARIESAEDIFQDFWFRTIESLEKKSQFASKNLLRGFWSPIIRKIRKKLKEPCSKQKDYSQDFEQEDFFQDFWLMIQKESVAEMRSKLGQEILELRKKELWNKYVALVPMIPFAALMAINLTTVCSHDVLLQLIGNALEHTIMPFEALSLICVIYLIYNKRKIHKKEQEFKELEEKNEKNNKKTYDIQDYFNYVEAVTTALVIISDIVNIFLAQEVLAQKVTIDEIAFLCSNLVDFSINSTSFYINNKKTNLEKCPNTYSKDRAAAGLLLTGSSMLLMRRIILITLVLSMNAHAATTIGAVICPVIGLMGIGCSIAGHMLTISSYKSKLQILKVNGRRIEKETYCGRPLHTASGPAVSI
ncbi:hypothetical protein BIY23_01160 [Wolbachia pipientis]|uniref:Uncharacterized protein n=1 Tax=Wolbachia pipientis TaxID=955 RepID=A0A1E7QLI6_WOLPI|nr:hypothetical protein [Wolbachia pipientis]OEY87079.1 hypothetical protein BIY23_01160 [Wolbachia pipientis]